MIIMKDIPIYLVSDSDVQKFSIFDIKLSRKVLVDITFQLHVLIESKICDEIESTKGAILFNGLTINDKHYVSVILSYMRAVWTTVHGRRSPELFQSCSIVSPSHNSDIFELSSEQLQQKAITFNIDTRGVYF